MQCNYYIKKRLNPNRSCVLWFKANDRPQHTPRSGSVLSTKPPRHNRRRRTTHSSLSLTVSTSASEVDMNIVPCTHSICKLEEAWQSSLFYSLYTLLLFTTNINTKQKYIKVKVFHHKSDTPKKYKSRSTVISRMNF